MLQAKRLFSDLEDAGVLPVRVQMGKSKIVFAALSAFPVLVLLLSKL